METCIVLGKMLFWRVKTDFNTILMVLHGKIPLEEGMATHSSILSWRISWTEEPGGSLGSQRVGHD